MTQPIAMNYEGGYSAAATRRSRPAGQAPRDRPVCPAVAKSWLRFGKQPLVELRSRKRFLRDVVPLARVYRQFH